MIQLFQQFVLWDYSMNYKFRIYLSLALIALSFVVSAPVVSAATPSFNVSTIRGQIIGPDNKPFKIATVTVNCNGISKNTVTGVQGRYIAVFTSNTCKAGSPVTVTAVKDGVSGSGSSTVQLRRDGLFLDLNISMLNLNMSVPEFGLIPGILAAITSAGAYIGIKRRFN